MSYHDRVKVQENIALAPYTTLRIGGPARYFVSIETEATLAAAVAFARDAGLEIFALGGGSNLVISDGGFDGLVLHMALQPEIVRLDEGDDVCFDVSAGTDWDELVRSVCEQGLCGMECLAGIPGLTGGSPIQNIGAYGQEVAQTIDQVTAFDLGTGKLTTLSAQECCFAYRRSLFNAAPVKRYLVTGVRFRMHKAAQPNLTYADLAPLRGSNPGPMEVYHFVRSVRAGKGMLIQAGSDDGDSRSAGSFFKNPVIAATEFERLAAANRLQPASIPHWPAGDGRRKLSAAWLIERAGFAKGFRLGPAGISTRHTLALTNWSGTAKCHDLLALRDLVVSEVQAKFGVTLHQEPVMLGDPNLAV